MAQASNPVSLAPWNSTGIDTSDILRHFFDPLWALDREGNLVGVLAKEWEMVSPTEWTITIREGVKFHDPDFGELTAEDVKASIEAAITPGTGAFARLPDTIRNGEVEVIGTHAIRWKLAPPGTAALPNWATLDMFITSKQYLEEVSQEQLERQPMGTGPYKFVEWVPHGRIVADAFEGYWGPRVGFDRITWRIIPNASTRKAEFLSGALDVLAGVAPGDVPEIEANSNLRVEAVTSGRMIFIALPLSEQPFGDPNFRLALNHAVNKQEIVDNLFGGIGAVPLDQPMPETLPKRSGVPVYAYDPEKAKQLLQEAGYTGEKITLRVPFNRYTLDREIGQAIVDSWQAVGINVELSLEPWALLAPDVLGGRSKDPFLVGFGNVLQLPEWFYTLWVEKRDGSRGAAYVRGPDKWDQLIRELGSLLLGDPRREEVDAQLQRELMVFVRLVPLIDYVDIYGVSNRVDWEPHPLEYRWFMDARPR